MTRWIATICIILVIAAGVIWEQVFLNTTFSDLENRVNALIASVEVEPDGAIATATNKTRIDDLHKLWLDKERVICYLVKHTETLQISDSIIYMLKKSGLWQS